MKGKFLPIVVLLAIVLVLTGCDDSYDDRGTNLETDGIQQEMGDAVKKPWEDGGKPKEEYTWEEFEALSGAQQEVFFEDFESVTAFEEWMNRVQPEETVVDTEPMPIEKPWENGGKAKEEYTWEEFEALSGAQQEMFFEDFASVAAFEEWMNRVHPEEAVNDGEPMLIEKPWENGGKAKEEYTWEEFEELSGAQQEAFFEAFESVTEFEEWMSRAQLDAQGQIEKPWENGGKAKEEYTWEEFEALSGPQQELFFEAFESVTAFETWMEKVKP